MKISNVKCSLIYSVPTHWKKEIKKNCELRNIDVFEYGNILSVVFSTKLCIIQKKIKFPSSKNQLIHVNVTGIRNLYVLKREIVKINRYIIPQSWVMKSFKIDNICSTLSFPSTIRLRKLSQIYENCRFNIDRFPAVFMKTIFGTVIVFESGKINILGCKSLAQIKSTWRQVLVYIIHASMINLMK